MATLTSQIEALITYANETTGNEDVRLGDAVKSLADGYKGGGTEYPLPTITDADSLPSQLTALIAYANGITGKVDATIGDAIRSLVEGYGGGGRLPSEYQEVEYIESTGTQYIDVGVKLNGLDSVSVKYQIIDGTTLGIFGARDTSSSSSYTLTFSNNIASIGYYSKTYQTNVLADNDWHYFELTGGKSSFDGIVVQTNTPHNFSTPRNCYIFAIYGYQNKVYTGGSVRIKEFTINESLKLISCYRRSDHKPGMYDLVSGNFLVNKDNGEDFIVGPDVN